MKFERIKYLSLVMIFLFWAGLFCGDLEHEESEEETESHYPGDDCGSCHGNQAREFTISGTVYTDSTGTTPAPGQVMVIRDMNNLEILRVTSDALGNFYSNTTIVYPAKAESFTSGNMMVNPFQINERSCNKSGCHDSNRRIY